MVIRAVLTEPSSRNEVLVEVAEAWNANAPTGLPEPEALLADTRAPMLRVEPRARPAPTVIDQEPMTAGLAVL